MPRMWRVVAVMGCVAGLAAPTQALAVVLVPPGKAGANQYFENVPTPRGNAAPPGAGSSGGGAGGSGGSGGGGASSVSNLSSLGRGRAGAAGVSRLGSQGKAAAALAKATAPSPVTSRARGEAGMIAGSHGGSATSALVNALGGSGGLGILLPGLLVIALLGALALLVARLRGRGRPPQLGA